MQWLFEIIADILLPPYSPHPPTRRSPSLRCQGCGGERRPIGSTSGTTIWYCGQCGNDLHTRYIPATGKHLPLGGPRPVPAAIVTKDSPATIPPTESRRKRKHRIPMNTPPAAPVPQQQPTFRPKLIPVTAPEPAALPPGRVDPADEPPGAMASIAEEPPGALASGAPATEPTDASASVTTEPLTVASELAASLEARIAAARARVAASGRTADSARERFIRDHLDDVE